MEEITMNYIVLDLEWNQSPSGKKRIFKSLPFEIIEIGAIKLNENFEIIDKFQETIRPVIYPHMHHISQEVTGFTTSELQHSRRFPDVFRQFLSWCGTEEYRFCTWGPLDLTELQRNMNHYHLPLFPAPVFYYDIQEIFSQLKEDGIVRRSLEYAVDDLHISHQGDFHRALVDAYYTARVMSAFSIDEVLPRYTVDTYQQPRNRKEEFYISYGTSSKYVSQAFPSKPAVIKDPEVVSMKCCICQKRLRKKIHWFTENSKNYYALAYCSEHGFLSGKIHIKKNDSDYYFAIKELTLTDQKGADLLFERKKDYQKKRNQRPKLTGSLSNESILKH